MSTPYVDDSGEVRLSGHLTAPGATVGDVLTVQADKTVSPAPGGGGAPLVSCVIQVTAQDIASASTYFMLWGAGDPTAVILDNWADQNVLLTLPDGIGLELNIDNLTTTEAGVWALTLDYGIAQDLTWDGTVSIDNLSNVRRLYANQNAGVVPVTPVTKGDSMCEIIPLPAGAQIATPVATSTPATAETLIATADLSIVRLA